MPEALLEAAHNDPHLAVVKSALQAFDQLTGYQNADIFGVDYADAWWKSRSAKLSR